MGLVDDLVQSGSGLLGAAIGAAVTLAATRRSIDTSSRQWRETLDAERRARREEEERAAAKQWLEVLVASIPSLYEVRHEGMESLHFGPGDDHGVETNRALAVAADTLTPLLPNDEPYSLRTRLRFFGVMRFDVVHGPPPPGTGVLSGEMADWRKRSHDDLYGYAEFCVATLQAFLAGDTPPPRVFVPDIQRELDGSVGWRWVQHQADG